jgi:hypothetical protein
MAMTCGEPRAWSEAYNGPREPPSASGRPT